VYNPATQSFVATGSLNHARTAATATLLQNGKVLIVGGQDNAGTLLSSAEIYDPTTGT
jgi:N-acetylneuraminic acid mutarotase